MGGLLGFARGLRNSVRSATNRSEGTSDCTKATDDGDPVGEAVREEDLEKSGEAEVSVGEKKPDVPAGHVLRSLGTRLGSLGGHTLRTIGSASNSLEAIGDRTISVVGALAAGKGWFRKKSKANDVPNKVEGEVAPVTLPNQANDIKDRDIGENEDVPAATANEGEPTQATINSKLEGFSGLANVAVVADDSDATECESLFDDHLAAIDEILGTVVSLHDHRLGNGPVEKQTFAGTVAGTALLEIIDCACGNGGLWGGCYCACRVVCGR